MEPEQQCRTPRDKVISAKPEQEHVLLCTPPDTTEHTTNAREPLFSPENLERQMVLATPPELGKKRVDDDGFESCDSENEDGMPGACSSSSMSPARRGQPKSQSSFQQPRRCRRQSSGLVFNPGSATLEVQNNKGECRYSLTRGERGEQMLTPLAERHALQAQGSATRSPYATISPVSMSFQESAGELFARFVTADTVMLSQQSFDELMRRCKSTCGSVEGSQPHQRIQQHFGTNLPWKARAVWDLLDARAKRAEYIAAPLAKSRVVVCGAGPCGIRAALELGLLHADVTIVEKRSAADAISRINRVHLWEWCKQDLLQWGAKVFDPPGGSFGRDNDFCHIGIGELQLLLIKNALLLGVKLHFETEAREVNSNALVCKDGTKLPCDVLILADGANSPLSRTLGLRSKAVGLRGKGSAIGVVANFVNNRDTKQQALRQFSWARQFNAPMFAQLEEATSINLENVVYYKGQAQHYMVMTPTKSSLVKSGVLRDGHVTSNLLHGSNVDVQRLSAMVQRIAGFFGLPTELCESQGAMIFDFSGVKRLESAATTVGNDIIAFAVGDALLEPFWPEGLGIFRGFMSALDAASATVVAAQQNKEAAVAQVAVTYNILKSVAAQSASQCLQKDLKQYSLQPNSRYISTSNFEQTST